MSELMSRGDSLPPFRKAIPTPESLDDVGVRALANAIILRTIEDYFDVCNSVVSESVVSYFYTKLANFYKKKWAGEECRGLNPDRYCDRGVIESFIDDDWFETLTDIPREVFMKKIKQFKENGKLPTLPRSIYVVPPDRRIEEEDYAHTGKRHNKDCGKHMVFKEHAYI